MNSLQISLIVLAIVAIGAILFYNWLQDRKYRKQWTATFGSQEDALLQPLSSASASADRIEPMVSAPEFAVAEPETVATVAISLPIQAVPSTAQPTQNNGLPAAPVDPLLEFCITVHALDAMPAVTFSDLMDSQRDTGRKVRWWGYADGFDGWTEISLWREQAFTDVLIAVQLADRAGMVTDKQLVKLSQEANLLASRFNGVAHWHDIAAVLLKARQLDQLCVDVDVLIGLNVISNDGRVFNGEKIAGLAIAANMRLSDAGVYQRCNDQGAIIYTLCNHEDTPFSADKMAALTTHGVTLQFEVPRVENGLVVFAELAQFGFQLANALEGKLVDDNIRPLSPAGIEKIQTQLAHIYQQMQAHEIPAGGSRALRLFN